MTSINLGRRTPSPPVPRRICRAPTPGILVSILPPACSTPLNATPSYTQRASRTFNGTPSARVRAGHTISSRLITCSTNCLFLSFGKRAGSVPIDQVNMSIPSALGTPSSERLPPTKIMCAPSSSAFADGMSFSALCLTDGAATAGTRTLITHYRRTTQSGGGA